MSIGDRIKEVREDHNKNQKDFASSIKIGQPTLSMFESGKRTPKDIHIEQICSKYEINEDWLRTGKGYKKKKTTESSPKERFSLNIKKLQYADNETIMRWINVIAETNPEVLVEIEKFMKKLLDIEDPHDES